MQEGLQRKLAMPKVKEPITAETLSTLVDSHASKSSLSKVHLVAGSLLAYAAFLYYDELAKLH